MADQIVQWPEARCIVNRPHGKRPRRQHQIIQPRILLDSALVGQIKMLEEEKKKHLARIAELEKQQSCESTDMNTKTTCSMNSRTSVAALRQFGSDCAID
ncbi:hypothetical protein niasHS_012601 [Heterodera schachtii]|uniref:Uncharacterized protein n=1 Tax=Heterodera schachtii TaxID=97005 RepID=A0ABD2I919_HETSC